jgi:hypothetical protein
VGRGQTLRKSLIRLKSKKLRTAMKRRLYRVKIAVEQNLTGQQWNAMSSQRSDQTGLPEILVSISKLCMNSTMPQVSKPWRGSS